MMYCFCLNHFKTTTLEMSIIKKNVQKYTWPIQGYFFNVIFVALSILAEQGKQDRPEIFLYSIYSESPNCTTVY